MNVTYSDKARLTGEDFKLLQQASNRLEEILGKSAPRVSAEWDRQEDPFMKYTRRLPKLSPIYGVSTNVKSRCTGAKRKNSSAARSVGAKGSG